jgi:hypothetical protein
MTGDDEEFFFGSDESFNGVEHDDCASLNDDISYGLV